MTERSPGREPQGPGAPRATREALVAEIERLEERLAEAARRQQEAEAERDERLASLQRMTADFENYRRRRTQEFADLGRYGGQGLFEAILPALDNLSRAVGHLPDEADDGLSAGLRMTVRQLEEALAASGIHPIACAGQPFDPAIHEAVMMDPGEGDGEVVVVAELRPGYRYHDRVVRPAQVRVARIARDQTEGARGDAQDPA